MNSVEEPSAGDGWKNRKVKNRSSNLDWSNLGRGNGDSNRDTARRGSTWIFGKISLLRDWSSIGTGSTGQWWSHLNVI